MRISQIFLYLLLVIMSVLTSCADDDGSDIPIDRGEDFYPISDGRVATYQVDSVAFNSFLETIDTFQYFVQYRTAGPVADRTTPTNLVIKSLRSDTAHSWEFHSEQEVSKSEDDIIENIANSKVIKLSFPILDMDAWDANIYNAEEEQIFSYNGVDKQFSGKYISSDSTVLIDQGSRINELEEIYAREVYARGIGLLYRIHVDKRSDQIGQEIPDGYECQYHLLETKP